MIQPSLQVLYFGKDVAERRGVCALALPVSHGLVRRFPSMPSPAAHDGDGPVFVQAGEVTIRFSTLIKFLHSLEPMPYGPVETCVGPALIPPPMKVDAKQHASHTLALLQWR